VGPDQFGSWVTHEVSLVTDEHYPRWLESVHDEGNVLWGWYHAEPIGLVPDSTMTAPKVGAVVSFDGGHTLRDLGTVLESGDALDPKAQNGYFAGGHGDFTVIADRQRTFFYFFFDNYGGTAESQGVCVARMAFEDRHNPQGKVWKFHNGAWTEAGRGGRVTPIFPVKKSWSARDPDALWGPSVHWNTALNCYVMLLNRAVGTPGWSQEGIYVSFSTDISRPESWTTPRKILDKAEFPGWYFFYPQVMGLEPGGTDRRAGRTARLWINGVSRWEIDFLGAPLAEPPQVVAQAATTVVKQGEALILTASATGSGLMAYQWSRDGAPIPGAQSSSWVVAATTAADAGMYTVTVASAVGVSTSEPIRVTVEVPVTTAPSTPPVAPAPPVQPALLANLSVRARLMAEGSALTLGFVVQGQANSFLVRAIGPALTSFGVNDALADPRLAVFDAGGTAVTENDNWRSEDASVFSAAGAFPLPLASLDAALVFEAGEGASTIVTRGDAAGVALVELYAPAASTASRIVNLSARAPVGPDEGVLIGGFTVTGAGSKRLLIRAVGPTLEAFGVGDALANPRLEIFDQAGGLLAENDDWQESHGSLFTAAGALALEAGSRDAAVVITLAAGQSYTAVVRSADERAGEAMLEIYELP
jgi:hypothetical protein